MVLRSGDTRLGVIADPNKWMWVVEKFQKQHRMPLAVKYKFHRRYTIAIERSDYALGPFPAKQIPLTEYNHVSLIRSPPVYPLATYPRVMIKFVSRLPDPSSLSSCVRTNKILSISDLPSGYIRSPGDLWVHQI
ncbi:hypothetical protein COCC4DRAFT_140261 [Bipolaris maydis ATCC 48331]|uniref:Uncharacterized protein n=2 Tax=Cochliobolus heterostrophus TaxID=5016 RepID=M2UTY5_COCH5|nr:uncharacterized protein COCC4DRAFT_140261 [Bipolaris maydis ATCC 48331]EMD97041.1 hypothetical protein COCHEDRAFT_1025518 [Bipolaris maydis C5]ENI04494.1 hypothetical protein COCC4DRAFT_140261 [Bipolaris maydis ATCC 48331]